ncbi:MAG: Vitamin B12 dependent methionine synthase activation subunit [Lachnospiraceae bacterium]
MEIEQKEVLRYLGYGRQAAEEQTMHFIEEITEELKRDSLLKSIYQEYDCKVSKDMVEIQNSCIKSMHLAKNLAGCERVILLAATIGRSADLMIKKYSVTNMAKASIAQAAGAAYIESYVEEIEAEIREHERKRGFYLRPRFSPGYGDFTLEYQKELFNMLECNKRIGIILTSGNLMMPSKTVTAVIGLTTKQEESCYRQTCNACEKIECDFRKETFTGKR